MGIGSNCLVIDDYEYKIKRSKVYATNVGEAKVNAGYITKRVVNLYWATKDFAETYINGILDTDEWGLVSEPNFSPLWANSGLYNVTASFEQYTTD